ncbi:MAG: hypothetical protein HOO95_09200 [Gallionella sp.]|nr:hypothetical protein [Gallionella sp.]
MHRMFFTVLIMLVQTSQFAMAMDNDGAWYEGCPKEIHNVFECKQHLEGEIVKKYPALISRKDSNLIIKLANGRVKVLANIRDEENEDQTQVFAFVKYFPIIQYGLLYVQFSEGGSYYLIDLKTGVRTLVRGEAVLSPDNRRFAIFNADVIAGYSPNILSVYMIGTKGLVQEFDTQPNEWGPVNLKWSNNQTVVFDKLVCCENLHNEKLVLRFLGKDITKKGKWSIAN